MDTYRLDGTILFPSCFPFFQLPWAAAGAKKARASWLTIVRARDCLFDANRWGRPCPASFSIFAFFFLLCMKYRQVRIRQKRKMAEFGEGGAVSNAERERERTNVKRRKRRSQPTKWRRATHSKKAWPIDPALFLCVCALLGSRNTQHALSWPPPSSPLFCAPVSLPVVEGGRF